MSHLSLVTRHLSHVTRDCIWVILALLATACESIAMPTSLPATYTPIATRAVETSASPPVLVAFPTAAPASPTLIPPTVPLGISVPTAPPSPRAPSSAPIVQVVSPLANGQVSINQTVYVVAYAADDQGITRIELSDDGNSVRTENAPTPAPQIFSAIIPWTPTQTGTHVLRVVAFDTDNRASAPDEVSVSVILDARRPTANIVYPIGTPQVEFGSVLQIHGIATDEVGVTQVDLWVDNQLYTYVTSQDANGQSPRAVPVIFAWSALTPGSHTLFLRAHDTQDQTTDSGPLKVLVANPHIPELSLTFERTSALVNEPITVTITALDASGIARVELRSGKDIVSTINSGNPARQTALTTQVIWQSAYPGDYQLVARAHNASGNSKESPAQTISILRPGQPTPTSAPMPTPTRTRAPRAPATPTRQPPPPPSAEIVQPADHFSAPSPLRVTFSGRANAELDRIEFCGYYQGQPNPQVVCVVDAHATTQKTGQCEWSPPSVGVVFLFAQAVDVYRQFGRSTPISGYVGVPLLPTPAPKPPSLTGRWSAEIPNAQYVAMLRQTGTALRGDFKIVGTGTPVADIEGRVTSGTLRGDRVTFHVDLVPPGSPTTILTPSITVTTAVAPTTTPTTAANLTSALDFDCAVDTNMTTLVCAFKDSRGRGGNIVFQRD